mgnify:CR=1 FL=1
MKILVINCGSSSLKYQLIDMERETVTAKGLCERIGIEGSKLTHKVPDREDVVIETPMPDHSVAVKLVFNELTGEHGVVDSVDEIDAIGHRVLHGANKFTQSCIVTPEVKKVIRECFDLGPLHNPANLMGIEACEKVVPGKKNIAVFDTTFGMSLPEKAYYYAFPTEYYEKYGIRRYGFHGTSHAYVSGETIRFGKLDPEKARVIVCHLGNGASISASIGGKAIDTSMGLTPLEGLMMGTRTGDIDPAVVFHLERVAGMSVEEVDTLFNKKSGMKGMTGESDMRSVRAMINNDDDPAAQKRARTAMDVYINRLVKYVGSYTAELGGLDVITFTAGIGENDIDVRRELAEALSPFGVMIDIEANKARSGEPRVISAPESTVKLVVFPTNEELAIARQALAFA